MFILQFLKWLLNIDLYFKLPVFKRLFTYKSAFTRPVLHSPIAPNTAGLFLCNLIKTYLVVMFTVFQENTKLKDPAVGKTRGIRIKDFH
jgi:hypothetical protein